MRLRTIIHGLPIQLFLLSALWLTVPTTVETELSRGDLSVTPSLAGTDACDHTIGLDISTADGRTNYAAVSPGDTVCIMAGTRNSLTIRNFEGIAENPITFINFGGRVIINGTKNTHGILVQNSRFFHLTGTGDPETENGLKIIYSLGTGIHITNKSSDFEVDHIEITGVPRTGILAKTNAVCSDGSTSDWNAYDYDGDGIKVGDLDDVVNRSNFTQYNSIFHENYIYHVGGAGMYIGSSFYQGNNLSCDSGTETVYAPLLRGVGIFNNTVEDTGSKGIQVGSAIEDCNIHHNEIYKDTQVNDPAHQGGVMNNRGSVCNIYNNFIKDGGGPGIYIHGNGNNKVYNNIIVNPGQNKIDGSNGNGISIATGTNPGNSIYVWNNTIINPYNYGIGFHNDKGSHNKIENNVIVDPEGHYVATGGRTNVIVSNNLSRRNISEVRFTGPASDDYSIQADSPAVDAGINLSFEGITVDCVGVTRPQGADYDIGACEYIPEMLNTPTPTAFLTATPTLLPSATLTLPPTATPTVPPTNTPTATPIATHTPTATLTVPPTNTPTATLVPTHTPAVTPSLTLVLPPTETLTPTATVSDTPTPLPTNDPTPTAIPTPTPTVPSVNSPTPTLALTYTPMETPTAIPTVLPTTPRSRAPKKLPYKIFLPAVYVIYDHATVTSVPTNAPMVIASNTPPPWSTNTPMLTPTATDISMGTALPPPTTTLVPTAMTTATSVLTLTQLPANTPILPRLLTSTSTPMATAINTPTATLVPADTPIATSTSTSPVTPIVPLNSILAITPTLTTINIPNPSKVVLEP